MSVCLIELSCSGVACVIFCSLRQYLHLFRVHDGDDENGRGRVLHDDDDDDDRPSRGYVQKDLHHYDDD